MTTGTPLSPYAAALGDRFGSLHPRLQRYFTAIPPGSVGIGIERDAGSGS